MTDPKMEELAVQAAKQVTAWEQAVLDVAMKQADLTETVDQLLQAAGFDKDSATLGSIVESLSLWLENQSSVPVKAVVERGQA